MTAAARRLGRSVPGMSHALRRLRTTFDDPLLVRAGRGMVLTDRAEALRPALGTVLSDVAQLVSSPREVVPAELERTFRLHVTDHVLLVLGPMLERRLRAEAPRVALDYRAVQANTPEVLREGRIDAAIGVFHTGLPELRRRWLFDDRLVCAVREGHPEVGARLDLETYTRLAHIRIAPRGRPGGIVERMLAAEGRERRVARSVPYFLAALHLTAASDDVLTASERMLHTLGPSLGLRVLEPPLPFAPYPLVLLWHPRRGEDPAHRWLRTLLFDVAPDVAPSAPPSASR